MEAVILMGLQASGKSTFYQQVFFHSHLRINLDMFRTRHREKQFLLTCLQTRQAFVIDNTNPTRLSRQATIQAAREAGFQVVGYYLQSRLEDCLRRNEQRPAVQRIPPRGIQGTAGLLELPSLSEGFHRLHYVSHDGQGRFIVEDWKVET